MLLMLVMLVVFVLYRVVPAFRRSERGAGPLRLVWEVSGVIQRTSLARPPTYHPGDSDKRGAQHRQARGARHGDAWVADIRCAESV